MIRNYWQIKVIRFAIGAHKSQTKHEEIIQHTPQSSARIRIKFGFESLRAEFTPEIKLAVKTTFNGFEDPAW